MSARGIKNKATRFDKIRNSTQDNILNPRQQKRLTTRQEVDEIGARELELYIMNDYQLYKSQLEPIEKNYKRKIKKGTFNKEKAVLGYLNLVDNGARKYNKEFGGTNFNKATRIEVAKRLTDDFISENINIRKL